MLPKPYWREMPASAFGDQAKNWIAVLPVAAIEQHGPHLPVGVDAIIGEGLVKRCIAVLPDDLPVTFLPVQEICKSNEHISFPGTLTMEWDVVIRGWFNIAESVVRAGVGTLVIITSHGGNVAPMEVAAREIREKLGLRVVTTGWGRLGKWQEIYQYDGPFIDIHAGEAETSEMLVLRPDLVDLDAARSFPSEQTRLAENATKLAYHGAPANISWLAEDLNAAGVVGDPTRADANQGERDLASTVEGFMTLMRDLVAEIEHSKSSHD